MTVPSHQSLVISIFSELACDLPLATSDYTAGYSQC